MPPMNFFNNGMQIEIIYSFVIILCGLMIYFGTRELYELTSHRGIKYLRESFLLFAVAFFFRSFIKIFFVLTTPQRIIGISSEIVQIAGLFIFIYFSSLAVFYLIYSLLWKLWNGKSQNLIYVFHSLALIISTVSIILNSARVFIILNLLILIFIFVAIFFSHKKPKKKKKNSLYIIYLLLFLFWVLNIIDVLVPKFLQTFQLLIYLASISIFLTILYKVLKKSGAN